MSIQEFHASLSNENAIELESLRALRDAENVRNNADGSASDWPMWPA